jgi:sigma-B regulation protein RsbU (phosphoserine phosphatase)
MRCSRERSDEAVERRSWPRKDHDEDSWWSLDNQVRRAAKMQKGLLPDLSEPYGDYHFAALYRPCEALGGDFYDIYRNGHRAALLVADVMGHGVEAALSTSAIKAVFQEIAATTLEPCELLARMSARLLQLVPRRAFVAAGVAILDRDASEVRYAHAGLPHPYLLRASSRTVEEVELAGCLLGLFQEDRLEAYERTCLVLEQGDVLLLASDGLGSIEDETEASFEEGRLQEALAQVAGRDGDAVVRHLMSEAVSFSQGKAPADDINLIAITRGVGANPA